MFRLSLLKKLPFFIFILFNAPHFLAQGLSTITGKIISIEAAKPLEYVSIKAYKPSDSSFVAATISHSDGKFELPIAPGTYYLKLNLTGYETELISALQLNANQSNLHLGTLRMQKI
ncbi:MAG: hypothetical protein RL078_1039, partial [Bacteroidota bacterium]